MRTVTVYMQPACQPCKATKRWLDKRGIQYRAVDVSQSPDDLAAIKYLGYLKAPVVIISNSDPETDIHWQDFNPFNLERYLGQAAA